MSHYGIGEWVDLARGLLAEEAADALRGHLAEGCSGCRRVAAFCDKLARACREMAVYQAPDSAVRIAHAMFPARGSRAVRLPVELVFDSFLVPAPAGLRASWQVGWQALYRAGNCSVDLRIEPELGSGRSAIIGQISNHNAPGAEMKGIPVHLKSGKLVLAETLSNRFGEFQMEYKQEPRLQLCMYLDGGSKCIQLPLKTFSADKPVATERLKLDTLSKKKSRAAKR